MYKILFIFITLPSFLFSQDRADEILNKVSEKTASYSNIEAHFTNTIISKAADINESQTNKDTIYKDDPTFNEKDFLKGAQNFFEMVIASFVKGDLKNIEM